MREGGESSSQSMNTIAATQQQQHRFYASFLVLVYVAELISFVELGPRG